VRLHRSDKGSWLRGAGYLKKPIFSESDLRLEGTIVQLVTIEPQQHVPSHYHRSCTEVFCITGGRGQMTIGDTLLELSVGDIVMCEPGEVHDARNYTDDPFVYIVFKTNVVPDDTVW
jgi:quercetin dioxygenase-like cupin family protein